MYCGSRMALPTGPRLCASRQGTRWIRSSSEWPQPRGRSSPGARYERDSVLFHESDYRYPIVTQLLRAALVNRGRLNVIDFGGSFGSTYRQCRPLLDGVDEVRWQVIEQPAFVSIGQREFTTEELSFVPTIQELTPSEVPALILLSSVLQYLEHPEPTLTQLLRLDATHLVVDRTPFSTQPDDRLCVQHTPSSIYDASYPCWILSAPRLRGLVLSEGWQIEAEFDSGDGHFRTARGLEVRISRVHRGTSTGKRVPTPSWIAGSVST